MIQQPPLSIESVSYTTRVARMVSHTAKLRNDPQFFLSITNIVAYSLDMMIEANSRLSYLKPLQITLTKPQIHFAFEVITLPRALLSPSDKIRSLVDRVITVSWSIVTIGCVIEQLKAWNLLDTGKLACRIGKFKGMEWLPSRSLSTTLGALCCSTYFIQAGNAGYKYYKSNTRADKESMIQSIAFFIFHGIRLAGTLEIIRPPARLVNSIGIGAYSIYVYYAVRAEIKK